MIEPTLSDRVKSMTSVSVGMKLAYHINNGAAGRTRTDTGLKPTGF